MYVRFQYVFGKSPTAILVESTRVAGKPRQRHIAYLGSIDQWRVEGEIATMKPWQLGHNGAFYRAWWWHNARRKLAAHRIGPVDRRKIEAALAEHVPPVSTDEVAAYDRAYTQQMIEGHAASGMTRTSPGAYLTWPKGTKGVVPRPRFGPFSLKRALAAAGVTE